MDRDTKTAIYSPPRQGLPHLVVTISNGEITGITPVNSHDQARRIMVDPAKRPIRLATPA